MSAFLTALHAGLHTPLGLGMLGGFVAAVKTDHEAYSAWKSWSDVTSFDWRTASFRWVKGAVVGALVGAGFGAYL